MARPSMFRGYTCSFCRCTWSHRYRHRRAHQSQCWQAGQTRYQGQAKGIKGRQLLLQILLLLLLEHVGMCAPLQVSLVASPTAPSHSSVPMLARPDVGNLRSTTLTSTRSQGQAAAAATATAKAQWALQPQATTHDRQQQQRQQRQRQQQHLTPDSHRLTVMATFRLRSAQQTTNI